MECRFKTRRKDEVVSYVLLTFNANKEQYRFQSGLVCKRKDWGSGYPKKINSTKDLRGRLDTLKRKCDDFIGEIIDEHNRVPTKYELEEFVKLILGKAKKDVSIGDYIDRYFKQKLPTVVENTEQCILLHVNHFRQYFGEVSLDNLDKSICLRYLSIVQAMDKESSTLNGYLKNVKAFLNWLYEHDFTNVRYSKYLKNFKQVEKPVIALTPKELELLEEVTLENERLRAVRDVFLFSCYTGLRFSDVRNFRKEMIQGDVFKITAQKTSERLTIPILNECRELLEARNYELPVISEQKTNKYLKELFHLVGLNRSVEKQSQKLNKVVSINSCLADEATFHLGRKTFITVSLIKGVPERIIRAITGHKNDADFRKYVAFVGVDLADHMSKFSKRA